jgi:hypothetical protein
MSQLQEERREFQRLPLEKPIAARLGEIDVQIVDLGVTGARVERAGSIPATVQPTLHFDSPRGPITLKCEIVYRDIASRAGLQFISALDGSDETLRKLLADLVTAAIERLRPATRGTTRGPVFDPEQTGMRIPVPYSSFRLESGIWRKRGAFIPTQPDTGFTVPVAEDPLEISRLSADYERAGAEGRQLIRLFAELRVCESLGVPRA